MTLRTALVRNRFTADWQDRVADLDDSVRQEYLDGVDLITEPDDAAAVVAQIVAQAERAIDAVGRLNA